MTKVALFLPNLQGGGAERMLVTLATALATNDTSVDLVLGHSGGAYAGLVPQSVRVVDLGAPRMMQCLVPLIRYLKTEQPAALLSTLDHASAIAIIAKLLSGVRVRLVVRVASVWSVQARTEGLRFRVLQWLNVRLFGFADRIVAISHGVAADICRTGPRLDGKVQVIHNPAFTPEIIELANRACSHPWLTDQGPPVILGVGRLDPEKDFATLICAFAELRRRRAVRLVILGEGNERDRLQRMARELGVSEDVSMPGFVDNPFAYMKRARVFALTSQFEGFANVLVEAMSLGTPVVSTNCPGGPPEILEGGRWGRLVPVGDFRNLAEALDVTLDRPTGGAVARARQFGVAPAVTAYREALGLSFP